MPCYAAMQKQDTQAKEHTVNCWTVKARFYQLPFPIIFKKMFGDM